MKYLKLLIFAVVSALVFLACNDNKPAPPPEPKDTIIVTNGIYSGILVVDFLGEEQTSDLTIEVITTQKEDSIMLFFHQVKFVSEMPMGFDIKIPVTCVADVDSAVLSGNGITPYLVGADDTPFSNFRIDNVDGTLNNDSLKVAMNMVALVSMGSLPSGTYPIKFKGFINQ
ncbi:MAG: hypothetical protein FWD66_09825 [Paludibacter sp.]|nr:hypothetical protein [Paludibacter sp.]